MPGLDGTGPCGLGPMTGRGQGFCVLKVPAGVAVPVAGLTGRAGRPFGLRTDPSQELALLRRQAEHIEGVLRVIHRRIGRLQSHGGSRSRSDEST